MKKLTNKKGYIDSVWLVILVAILIVIGLFAFAALLDKGVSDSQWNNGHCPDCETEWRYIQAVGHKSDTKYIWVCDRCGKSIEVNNEPDWKTVKTGVENGNT